MTDASPGDIAQRTTVIRVRPSPQRDRSPASLAWLKACFLNDGEVVEERSVTKGRGFGVCLALALMSCGNDPPSGVLQVGDVADSHGELVRVVACVVRDDATGEDLAWLQRACDAEPTFSLGMIGLRGFDYSEFLLDKYEGRTCVITGRIEPVFEGRSVLTDAIVVTCVPESVRRLLRSNRLDE